jgi:hypothetical protein
MTTDDALHIKPKVTWQLVLEFVSPFGQASDCEAVQRIREAVGDLGLQPVAVRRMESAVLEALQTEAQRQRPGQHCPAISVRVWLGAQPPRGGAQHSDLEGQRVHSQEGSGWGFFLLERHEEGRQAPGTEPPRVIELCLYQESALARQERQPERPDST